MRMRYHSDDGAPCWKCNSTSYGYAVDDLVTYINAWCIACGADNVFYPPRDVVRPYTTNMVSAAHRDSRLTNVVKLVQP